jgi:hypothetical protein
MYLPPPNANDWDLSCHISSNIDKYLQDHSYGKIILTGDFNKFKEKYITGQHSPTRENAILDKIFTNISQFYNEPIITPYLGKSDHMTVIYSVNS